MAEILDFIKQVVSTPAIFVGLIAMVGLLLQKKDAQTVIKGTIKTTLGFIILNSGSLVIQQAILPFGQLFQMSFHVQGVVPNNEAITSMGLTQLAIQTSAIFAIGMLMNIVLARFSKWKFIFLTGHHALYMSCLLAIIFSLTGMSDWQIIVGGGLLLGFLMAFSPAIMQPTMRKITGGDDLALGHFGSSCYWLSAQIGKLCATKSKGKTVQDIKFPQSLSFLRENTVSIAIVMFICYVIVAGIAYFTVGKEATDIFKNQNWFIYSIIQAVTFSAGIYIVLAGVRMLIAEIVPAFKGISEKLVPNAKPALDCPVTFPFAPNAVLIGFVCSFIGGIVGLAVLAGFNAAGIVCAVILPGAVVHFFCGATAGICGNATGGLKGCIAGSFVHGIAVTFLAAALLPVLGDFGFANTTFSDADFTIVGIIFGNLSRMVTPNILFAIICIIFILPIIYNYTIGRKTGCSNDKSKAKA